MMVARMKMPPLSVCALTIVLAATQAFSLLLSQKPPDEAFDKEWPNRGDTVRPRMLVMRGCSGSSAVMQFARHLMRFHGIPVPSAEMPRQDADGNAAPPPSRGWPDELLKPNVNWFYKKAGEDIGKAMNMAFEDCSSQNQTMVFKGMIGEITDDKVWAQLKPVLQSYHAFTVLSSRVNMLDQLICQVKDCFHEEYGVPVDADTGERSHLCFNRRDVEGKSIDAQNNDKKTDSNNRALFAQDAMQNTVAGDFLWKGDYLAKLNADNVIHGMEREYEYVRQARTNLKDAGFYFKEINEEDLTDFEADQGALERGVTAWVKLLESFGVDVDEAIVRRYLKDFANTYPPADKHSALIYNFAEIKNVLRGTKYEQFIRQ